jgi:lysozyme
MYKMLGPHVNQLAGGITDVIAIWKPPVVVTIARDSIWHFVKQVSPNTRIVLRAFEDDSQNPDFGQPIADIAVAAQQLTERAIDLCAHTRYDYLQILNEPTVSSRDSLVRQAQFEVEAMKVAARYGVKLAIGCFSVGNPRELEWWSAYHGALAEARESGGVLLLHEYNWPTMQSNDDAWYSLRHRQVYDRLPESLRIPLIIGETGLDRGCRPPDTSIGWRGVDGGLSPEGYLAQLASYDSELYRDYYVLGAAVFCAGQPDKWWSFNIWETTPGVLCPMRVMAERADPEYRNLATIIKPLKPNERRWGVDVSEWQGKVDWARVKKAGVSFVFLRATVGLRTDRCFDRNHKECDGKSIPYGVYHYIETTSPMEKQADHFLAVAKGGFRKPFWWWADAEENALRDDDVHGFVKQLELGGITPGIYTSWYKAGMIRLGEWVADCPLWVADWRGLPAPLIPRQWAKWAYWQYTSKGHVDGIPTHVDLNWENNPI